MVIITIIIITTTITTTIIITNIIITTTIIITIIPADRLRFLKWHHHTSRQAALPQVAPSYQQTGCASSSGTWHALPQL